MLHPTIDKLRRLRLIGMAKALEEQLAQPDSERLSFDERLGILVDREEVDRQNAALAQRLRLARLRQAACLEDIDYRTAQGLDRALIRTLSSGQWLAAAQQYPDPRADRHRQELDRLRPRQPGRPRRLSVQYQRLRRADELAMAPGQQQVRPPAGADREDRFAHSR